jgi:regulator of protease activity HflC (stomatin/prohibitin superfamily)
VNVTPQSTHVSFDDFSSHDNILLDFETTIQFQYTDSVKLIEKFGEQWFANNVARQYGAIVREAVKKRTMSDMMSDVNTATELDAEVTAALEKHIKEQGLPVRIIGVSLGRAKPNANVLAQMNETAAQQQRQKTLDAATEAENRREKEQIAKAKADNAYRNAMGLNPEEFVQLEKIKRYSEACMKAGNVCVIDASGKGGVNINK